MKNKLVTLMAWLLTVNFSAHADLISLSSPIFGPNSLTYDTNNSLYWLSPNETVGKSFNEVLDVLSIDGRFAGFRFATVNELTGLFASAGIQNVNDYGDGINGTTANVPGAELLQSLLGITYSYSGTSLLETSGFVGSPHGDRSQLIYIGDIIIRNNLGINNAPCLLHT